MLVNYLIQLPSLSLMPGEALCSSLLRIRSVCMGREHKQEHHRQNLDCVKAVILKDHSTKAADAAGQGR